MNTELELAIAEYRKLLAHHDWFYGYSDDMTVYRRGLNETIKLKELQLKLDPDMTIWNEFAK